MPTFIIVFLSILAFLVLFLILFMLRNERVYRIRIRMIDEHFYNLFKALPSYNEMLYKPRYWGMWRYTTWEKWARGE